MNKKVVEKCHDEILEVLQKYHPTLGELVLIYGNLGYSLGASVNGYKNKGPNIDELKKMYYTKPNVGVALMLTGVHVTMWYEDLKKQDQQSMEAELKQVEKETIGESNK